MDEGHQRTARASSRANVVPLRSQDEPLVMSPVPLDTTTVARGSSPHYLCALLIYRTLKG
jgi:hypothetical protein